MRKKGKSFIAGCAGGEMGQALILVLVFVLLGSLTIVPALSFMSTALKSGVSYENKTKEYYAADAGIEDGIWQIKYDRLPVLAGDPDFAYNFEASCSYDIDGPINGFATNVTIENFWIPTADNPYATPAGARAVIERDVTDNETNRLEVTDTALDDVSFRIKINFYPANGVTDNLSVSSIGVWLPHGFSYNGTCNLATFDGTRNKYTQSVTSRPGGQAVVWDFSAHPLDFPDLPPEELDPYDNPQSAEITFHYAACEVGTRPSAIAWIVTDGPLAADIPMVWDIDTKYYKITSVAGGTKIEAYASRSDLRRIGAAFPGDYVAIGNTLMTDNSTPKDEIRETLFTQSTADTRNPDLTYRIPANATVLDAYLYWSGWFKIDQSHPKARIHYESCTSSNLTTYWSQNSTVWRANSVCFTANYSGNVTVNRYLTLKNPVNLAGRAYGSVLVGWSQNETGTLEPLTDPVNGDALQFQFSSDNGTTWSGLITAFDDDIGTTQLAYYYIVPVPYLTSQFKIRFYLRGFAESGEYCSIDDFHIGDVADRNITFKIGDPLVPVYSGGLAADQFWVIGNAATGEYSYSCKKDVSTLLQTYSLTGEDGQHTGNGQYTLGGADADTGTYWSYAGWSLIIIYSSPETAGHQLFLFDRFAFCDTDVDLDFDFDGVPGGDINGFIIPEPIPNDSEAAKLTCFVGDGDNAYHDDFIALNAPEEYRSQPGNIPNSYKLWDGISTSYNSESAPNNVWNSKFKIGDTGSSSIDGIDIDTFHISWASGLLHADDTSAHIDIFTNFENFNLMYLILSVRSKVTIGGTRHYLITTS